LRVLVFEKPFKSGHFLNSFGALQIAAALRFRNVRASLSRKNLIAAMLAVRGQIGNSPAGRAADSF